MDLSKDYEANIAVTWPDIIDIKPLQGDASTRRYYRASNKNGTKTSILMRLANSDLPPSESRWLKVQQALEAQNLPVPAVTRLQDKLFTTEIQDLGDQTLVGLLNPQNQLSFMTKAMNLGAKFLYLQNIGSDVAFDKQKLCQELYFFRDHFLVMHLGIAQEKLNQLNEAFNALSEDLSQYSHFHIHRDFHGRNLMISQEKMWVIDFQDIMLGPPAYDFVSLIYDPYCAFDANSQAELKSHLFSSVAKDHPLLPWKEIEETWVMTKIHRLCKALGSFAFLELTNKGRYLHHAPCAISTLTTSYLKGEHELLNVLFETWKDALAQRY
jgi:aminoglycoside/choline kinase family phosphotransferase